jgi:hypothetical protein
MRFSLFAVIGTAALLTIAPALAAQKELPFWQRGLTGIASAPVGDEASATAPAAVDALAEADVVAGDLLEAGFTAPVAIQPRADAYRLPTYYFRVQETSREAAWGQPPNEAADLVAVLARPLKVSEAAGLSVGKIEYQEVFGRFQARTYRNGRYLVVTGPDGDKVANLIKLLERKKF